MKKLFILLLAVIAISVSARVTTKVFNTPANIAAWGTAADTLVASAADTLVLKVTSNYVGKMNLLLFTDAVSGTPAYSAVLSGSINQVGWTALDTITHSGGGDKTAYFDLQDLKYNYYRVIITATSDAQKQLLYLYGLSRY
jgi:hypothetical protein